MNGNVNTTTGNWESDFDFHLLPKKPVPKLKPDQSEKDMSQAEVSKRREERAGELAGIITYLEQWAPWYRHNLFSYKLPEVFTPVLPGYLYVMKQVTQSTYTLTGKVFLWVMILMSCMILKNQGYFNTVKIDENPRSLNNRLNDQFFRHTYKADAEKAAKTPKCCITIGLLLVVIGGALYVWLGNVSQIETLHAIDSLEKGLETMVTTAKTASPLLKKINEQNIFIPRGIRVDDTLIVQDSLELMVKANAVVNTKFAKFVGLMVESSITKPMFMVPIILFACLVASGALVGISKNLRGPNLCGFFMC